MPRISKATILAFVLALIIFSINTTLFLQYNNMPNPLYGGDQYFHLGVANHIFYGGSPIDNSQIFGEYAHYPWLMQGIVAGIAKASGTNPLNVAMIFPSVFSLLSVIICYYLGRKIFDNDWLGLLFAFLFTTSTMPIFVPTNFALQVMFPAFLLSLCYVKSWRGRIIAGIILGVASLSHVTPLIAGIMLLAVLFIYCWFVMKKKFYESITTYLPIGIIGITISMLFWWAPLFVYKGLQPNRWMSYALKGEMVDLGDLSSAIIEFFYTQPGFALMLFAVLGLIVMFSISKKRNEIQSIPWMLLLVAVLGLIHPAITLPLFGASLGSFSFNIIFMTAVPMLIISGASLFFDKPLKNEKYDAWISYVGLITIVVLIVLHARVVYGGYGADQWTSVGKINNPYIGFGQMIVDNTELDAVAITTHGETAFAYNAISGRKVLFARRTHMSTFVDANERIKDAAIILYGNNSDVRRNLLEKYNIRYLFEDDYSAESHRACQEYFDRFCGDVQCDASYVCLQTDVKYEGELNDNGIDVRRVRVRLDPASNEAPRFDMIIIRPNANTEYLNTSYIFGDLGTPRLFEVNI